MNITQSRAVILASLVGVLIVGFYLYKSDYFKAEDEFLPASIGRVLTSSSAQVLIKFKSDISDEKKKEVLYRHGLEEKSEIKHLGVKVVSISGRAFQNVLDDLKRSDPDSIEFAEPDFSIEPGLVPDDPWFQNWQKDKQQINAPGAWDISTGSADIILAVIDTGINCNHEDLSSQCINGWNFYNNNSDSSDVHGHGTAVAGVAGATGNNGLGIAGNSWQSKIMPLRVSAPDGTSTFSSIASAIVYAADNGARVVNASYQAGGSSTVRSAASYLKNKGGLLVVSEGNYSSDTGFSNSPDIISVSAVDASDIKYSWSSYGIDVDVSAPGCTGSTTSLNGGYSSFCGTSNSAPEVSGLLALMWSVNPYLSPDQVQNMLFQSSVDLGISGYDQYYGWGRIDALKAAEDVRLSLTATPTVSPSVTPTPKGKSNPKSRR